MQKIGLEAILELAGFERGLNQYKRGIAGMEQDTEDASQEMGRLDKAFDILTTTLGAGALAIGTAAAAFVALKKVMEFGKEGAIIAQTRDSFDRLVASMGAAPNILEQMRAATNNTVDDMTLMSSTLTLVAGTTDQLGRAMIDAAPQLLEIAKAANKLNPTLGDTAFLYQSLATGIKRSSPLILDNLGLTIKVGDANEKYAAQLGITVEQMSAEDKQMALLTATLEAGDRMIQQVGGNTEAMGDSFAEAEAQIKNATDSLKASFAPALADVASTTAEATPKITDAANRIIVMGDAALDWVAAALSGKDATEAFNEAISQGTTGMSLAEQRMEQYSDVLGWEERQTLAAAQASAELSAKLEILSADADGVRDSLDAQMLKTAEAARETQALADAAEAAALAEASFKAELDFLHAAIKGTIGPDFEALVQAHADLGAATAAGADNIDEMTEALAAQSEAFQRNTAETIYNIAEKQILDALEKGLIEDVNKSGTAYDEASAALVILAEKLGIVDEGTVALTGSVQEQVEKFISGETSAYNMAGGLGALSGSLVDAAAQGDALTTALDKIPRDIDVSVNITSTWSGPTVPATGPDTGAPGTAGYMQHGGEVEAGRPYMVGEAGPELFVPKRGGTILPNDWAMNLPAAFRLALASTDTIGPTVNVQFGATTINSGMDQATFEARVELAVARAVRGI